MFAKRLRRRLRRRRALAARCRRRTGDTFAWDEDVDLRPQGAVLRRHARPAEPGHRHLRCPRAAEARRLGHHRPHLAGRLDQGRTRPPASTSRRTASSRKRLQLLRLAPWQPRGHDPRHVRQHPPASNQIAADGTEGGFTRDFTQSRTAPSAYGLRRRGQNYQAAGTPLVVLAGKEYGSGSSRDWAAKGTALLGVKAVIAESYERIHRSNLIGMGVIPLQFPEGENAAVARPDRRRRPSPSRAITELNEGTTPKTVKVTATRRPVSQVLRRRRPHRHPR